jgi:NAD(P)-dependent dehydrogenase (short-subunit alcohol dehydrogenase family)
VAAPGHGRRGRPAGRWGRGELLAAAVERLTAAGAEVLWADGRDAALPFYERHGWKVQGDGFVAAGGIPHHVVVLDLTASAAGGGG